jgi:hypothetical protein
MRTNNTAARPISPRDHLRHIYQSARGTVLESLRDPNPEKESVLAYGPRHVAGPPPTTSEKIDAILAIWQQKADEDNHPTQCTWALPSGRILKIRCEPNERFSNSISLG